MFADAVGTHKCHEWIEADKVHREGMVLERARAFLGLTGIGGMFGHGRWRPIRPESSDQQGPDTVTTGREAV